jgi:hypothetical protein
VSLGAFQSIAFLVNLEDEWWTVLHSATQMRRGC